MDFCQDLLDRFRFIAKWKTFKISYCIIDKAIHEAGKLDGVYVIVTNLKKVSPEDVISSYRNRI